MKLVKLKPLCIVCIFATAKFYAIVFKNMEIALEKKYRNSGFNLITGVDEAGRGPLAGPVVAAAVAILNFSRHRDFKLLLRKVDDSKKLSVRKRELIYQKIIACPYLVWGAAKVSNKIIDKINIFEASKLAMANAVKSLRSRPAAAISANKFFCLVDGNFFIPVAYSQKSIIGGDAEVFSIAAASIIAKVWRDRIMLKMDKIYPAYGFARHKGYPTAVHRAALAKYGPCPIHRRSFKLF